MADAPVCVVVVSWNTRDLLRECLDSLRPDVDGGVAEVVVVDNASTDGSADLVREEFGWARLEASAENLGFGQAVNLGARGSEAAWIAPSNADVALEPGALGRMLQAGAADPRAGAIAPRLVLPDGGTQHSVHHFPTVGLSLALALGLTSVVPGLGDRLLIEGRWDSERARAVDWAHGAFLIVRREAWDAIGGFDPEQWMYAEDLDLAWRLRAAGWGFRYEPEARVRHAVSAATAKAFGAGRVRRYMDASYAWMARRRGAPVAWTFAAVNLASATARWAVLAGPARLAPRRYAARRDAARLHARAHLRGLRPKRDLLEAG